MLDPDSADLLASALPHLENLTCLDLHVPHLAVPPTALTALTQLRSLGWRVGDGDRAGADADAGSGDAAFLQGEWVEDLRTLAAPAQVLARSLPALSAAHFLEHLGVDGARKANSCTATAAAVRAVLRWAAQRSSLRRLSLTYLPRSSEIWQEARDVMRQRPELAIDSELLWCLD